jgi:hypothetical protein
MPQYLLNVIQPDGEPPAPEILDPIIAAVDAVQDEMKAAGVWVFSAGLHPASAATVVRRNRGETLLTDGPYVEASEHNGGFTIVDVADLDAALDVAGRLAEITTLPIEVRPFQG